MKVGDKVRVFPIHNLDCDVCLEEGTQCWGKHGEILYMGLSGVKPIEVLVENKDECAYEEQELELI
jgi:hypothetical protein